MLQLTRLSLIVLLTGFLLNTNLSANERADEIRQKMWESNEPAFSKTEIPGKWSDEEAIILAQLNRYEYRKPVLINEFYVNRYFHKRIKLNHKNAVNDYSEISFPADRGRYLEVFTGFKLIKPDGTEKIIDASEAVLMEQKQGSDKRAYKKLAIPNLEVGDIIDYYICEDQTIQLATKMYFFNPVQFSLPQEYPVVEQKLEFQAQRRCFISLRSFNGAPELQLETDEENDEQIYTLVDKDRDAVKDLRWFYQYRELPSVKFRAAYASGKALRENDVLLGEPGIVKSSVSKKELAEFVTYLLTHTFTDSKQMLKHVKKTVPKDAGNFEKAKAGYYYRRNNELQWAEVLTVADKDSWNQNLSMYIDNRIQFLDRFSSFLANQDIPYDIVIVIPRHISSLDDLLLENELEYLIRVKEGDKYMYFSDISNYKSAGEFDSELMGTDAYIVDGLANFSDWDPKRITIPVTDKEENSTIKEMKVKISDNFDKIEMDINSNFSGVSKPYYQNILLDFYDYEDEERANYKMREDFKGTFIQKRLLNLRDSYLSTREESRNDLLKNVMENNYDFKIDTVYDFSVIQTGRFDTTPELIFSFHMESEELLSKVGRNYLFDVGKLIENQVKIDDKELERNYGIYMNSPRSYNYKINIAIPEGFIVQGVEKLTNKVENSQGGFISSAKVENGELIIETNKFYNNNYADKEAWPEIISFLNTAFQFTEQKVLFKKK